MKHGIYRDLLLLPGRQPSLARTYEAFAEPKMLPAFCRHKRHGKFSEQNPEGKHSEGGKIAILKAGPEESFIFGGYICHHFGHFVSEYVHRLWLFSQPGYEGATAVFVNSSTDLYVQPFFEQVMDYFGVKKWRILTEPTLVKKIAIAEAGQYLGQASKPAYIPFLSELFKKHSLYDPVRPKKIAITRGHLTRGNILGEAGFEKHLARAGYVVFRPEDHSILDQLRTIANARDIIITEGSACHLFDLLPPLECNVAFIARRPGGTIDKASICGKVKNLYRFDRVRLLMSPPGPRGVRLAAAGISYIDYQQLAGFLYQHGFLDNAVFDVAGTGYHADLVRYMSANFCNTLDAPQMADASLHMLLQEVLGQPASKADTSFWLRLVRPIRGLLTKKRKTDSSKLPTTATQTVVTDKAT